MDINLDFNKSSEGEYIFYYNILYLIYKLMFYLFFLEYITKEVELDINTLWIKICTYYFIFYLVYLGFIYWIINRGNFVSIVKW